MSAIRGKTPQPQAELTPFYFPFVSGSAGGSLRPQPKYQMNFAKLRVISEQPIPRRAIDYTKNQISMLDWNIVTLDGKEPTAEQMKKITRVRAILEKPNNNDSWRTFVEQVVEDMLVIGYSSVEKIAWPANQDRPMVLYPFDGSSLHLYANWDGSPSKPRYAQIDRYGQAVDFRDNQLMYIRYNPRTSTPWGLSPLEVASQTIDYLLNAQAYAGRMAHNGTARKLLDLGEGIDAEQLNEFRSYWVNEVEGRGHTPIFGGSKGVQSVELGAANDESLYLKWQNFLINQIANAFGLDSQKFGAVLASRSTGDQLDDNTDESTVRPLANSIAAAINRGILEALGITDLKFAFRWTANYKDRKSLAAVHQIYMTQDVMMIDEARNELGLSPLPDGKGKYTLTEYRAIYGVMNQGTGAPSGVMNDEKKAGMTPTTGLQPTKDDASKNDTNPNSTSKVVTREDKPVNKAANPLKAE